MCDRVCELMIACCGTLCKACCRYLSSKRAFLIQFIIYGILQGFNVATDAALFVELFKTHQSCKSLKRNLSIHCASLPPGNVTRKGLDQNMDTLEILEYTMMIVMGIGGVIYIVHIIILLPNLWKHFRDPEIEAEVEAKQAPRYYMNIIMTHCIFMCLETIVHDIPASCLTMEIAVHFWGVNCWECTTVDLPLPMEQSASNSTMWIGLMITCIPLLAIYKGLVPLYFWVGNPFCWSCYCIRFLIAMPLGLVYMVMVMAPCMGVASLRLIPKVPRLKAELGGTADTFWSIGLVFWGLGLGMVLIYFGCRGTIKELCPCLAWCDEPKTRNKQEKEPGCICF